MKIALCFLSRKDLFNQNVWKRYFDPKLFNIYISPDIGYKLRHFATKTIIFCVNFIQLIIDTVIILTILTGLEQ